MYHQILSALLFSASIASAQQSLDNYRRGAIINNVTIQADLKSCQSYCQLNVTREYCGAFDKTSKECRCFAMSKKLNVIPLLPSWEFQMPESPKPNPERVEMPIAQFKGVLLAQEANMRRCDWHCYGLKDCHGWLQDKLDASGNSPDRARKRCWFYTRDFKTNIVPPVPDNKTFFVVLRDRPTVPNTKDWNATVASDYEKVDPSTVIGTLALDYPGSPSVGDCAEYCQHHPVFGYDSAAQRCMCYYTNPFFLTKIEKRSESFTLYKSKKPVQTDDLFSVYSPDAMAALNMTKHRTEPVKDLDECREKCIQAKDCDGVIKKKDDCIIHRWASPKVAKPLSWNKTEGDFFIVKVTSTNLMLPDLVAAAKNHASRAAAFGVPAIIGAIILLVF